MGPQVLVLFIYSEITFVVLDMTIKLHTTLCTCAIDTATQDPRHKFMAENRSTL